MEEIDFQCPECGFIAPVLKHVEDLPIRCRCGFTCPNVRNCLPPPYWLRWGDITRTVLYWLYIPQLFELLGLYDPKTCKCIERRVALNKWGLRLNQWGANPNA